MESILHDVRYGVRMLLKSLGFTGVAALTLALGIGANTAIFSVVDAVLLRPLPHEDPDRLVRVYGHSPRWGEMPLAAPDVLDFQEQKQVFADVAAFESDTFILTGADRPERPQGQRVSATFFGALGVGAGLGRTFLPEEGKPGQDRVAVISHGLWERRFGRDPNLTGKTLTLNGETYTVAGVMPLSFRFPSRNTELWAAVALETYGPGRASKHLDVIARLKPSVTMGQVQRAMNILARRQEEKYPDQYPETLDRNLNVAGLHGEMVEGVGPVLWVLLGGVGFVLLIACTNVANLFLTRAAQREKEVAVRAALGRVRSASFDSCSRRVSCSRCWAAWRGC